METDVHSDAEDRDELSIKTKTFCYRWYIYVPIVPSFEPSHNRTVIHKKIEIGNLSVFFIIQEKINLNILKQRKMIIEFVTIV